jgi:hypothetical protein
MDKVIYNRVCLEFISAGKEVARYTSCNLAEPKNVEMRYKSALAALRDFLDDNDTLMPEPKWHYSEKDKTTWAYLNVILGVKKKGDKKEGKIMFKGVVENPDFGFKELL